MPLTPPISFTATTTLGSTAVTGVSSMSGLVIGQALTGTAWGPQTFIIALGSSAFTTNKGSILAVTTAAMQAQAAQTGWTLIQAAGFVDLHGIPLASGTAVFTPNTSSMQPVGFRTALGQAVTTPYSFPIVAGAIAPDGTVFPGTTIPVAPQLPDVSTTFPVNIGFTVKVHNNANQNILGPGYFIQPTGAAFNFDTYEPNQPNSVTVQVGPTGAAGANGQVVLAALVSSIGGTVSGTIGNTSGPITASGVFANTFQLPFASTGYLKTLTVPVSAFTPGANITLLIESQSGTTFTQVARIVLPVKNTGNNVYVDGVDFSMVAVEEGQWPAILSDGNWTFEFQNGPGDPFPYQFVGDPGSGSATWTLNTGGLIAATYVMYELPDLATASDITPATYTLGALSSGGGNTAGVIAVITDQAATASGTISQIDATIAAFTSGGKFWAAVFENTGGSNFRVVSRTAITAAGTGHQAWVGGTDYVAPVILAGQYPGYISIDTAAEIEYGTGSGSVLFFAADPGSVPQAYSSGGPPSVLFTVQPYPLASEGYVNAAVTNKFVSKPVNGSVIIFLGSSITAGLGVSAAECFAGLIAASQWAAGATVYNIGISGQTSTGCLAQYTATSGNPNMPSGVSPHDLGPNVTLNPEPCWLILDLTEITNDFTNSITAATGISNLQAIVSAAKTDGYIVVLLTSPILGIGSLSSPLGGVNAASATQNRAVASAVRTGVIPWDLFGELSDVIPDQHNAVYYQDGTHPTVAGHKALANVILSVLVSGGGASNFNKDYHHDPNTFIAGVIIPDSAGSLWKLVVSTGGTLSATAYTPVDTDE